MEYAKVPSLRRVTIAAAKYFKICHEDRSPSNSATDNRYNELGGSLGKFISSLSEKGICNNQD